MRGDEVRGPSRTATRAGTSSDGYGWSFASSFATTTPRPAPAPGSTGSASAAWPAALLCRTPLAKPPDDGRSMTATRARQSRTQTPSVESGDRRGAVRLPRGVRAAPFSRHSEHAHDRSRHHFRGLHAPPERARRDPRPSRRRPSAGDGLGAARLGKIDDRTAGRGRRWPRICRRPCAPARPRRFARHPLA